MMEKESKYQKVMKSIAKLMPEKLRPVFLHPAGKINKQ